jgi:hypothetical protein
MAGEASFSLRRFARWIGDAGRPACRQRPKKPAGRPGRIRFRFNEPFIDEFLDPDFYHSITDAGATAQIVGTDPGLQTREILRLRVQV